MLAGAGARLLAQATHGATVAGSIRRYADPLTELDVYLLTDPAHTSLLPAHYNRAITKNSGPSSSGATAPARCRPGAWTSRTPRRRPLTDAEALDPSSLTLTPDNRSFCYFAGRALYLANFNSPRQRKLYEIPEGWERCEGMAVGPDGTHATFAEKKGESSRIRMVTLTQGVARTVVEAPFVVSHPVPRPMRAQILYRRGDEALWLVNQDGAQNRQLKLNSGRVGPANWSSDGRILLYLNFPEDPKELNTIREHTTDGSIDKLVAKTSQFAHFGFNNDTSVFVGASRNLSSPALLLLLRVTRREMTLCEHKSSADPGRAPILPRQPKGLLPKRPPRQTSHL